jgi:hypothetical protein
VIDPDRDTIDVYRLAASGYARTSHLSVEGDDTLTTSLLPGLAMPLARIFKD